MSQLTTVGFEPPVDFPVEPYEKVHLCLTKYKDLNKAQWHLFALGWNGLAYRYRALAECDQAFTASIKLSASPIPEVRYEQGKSFFGFFTNSVSAVSSFFFSMYCVASILDVNNFPVTRPEDLNVYPKDVEDRFQRYFGGETLQKNMTWCLKESMYWKLNDIHRVLMHRGMPPRRFHKGGDLHDKTTMPSNLPASSDKWKLDLPVDESSTNSHRQWLSNALDRLVSSAADFCGKRL